jgi:hypothetical protein
MLTVKTFTKFTVDVSGNAPEYNFCPNHHETNFDQVPKQRVTTPNQKTLQHSTVTRNKIKEEIENAKFAKGGTRKNAKKKRDRTRKAQKGGKGGSFLNFPFFPPFRNFRVLSLIWTDRKKLCLFPADAGGKKKSLYFFLPTRSGEKNHCIFSCRHRRGKKITVFFPADTVGRKKSLYFFLPTPSGEKNHCIFLCRHRREENREREIRERGNAKKKRDRTRKAQKGGSFLNFPFFPPFRNFRVLLFLLFAIFRVLLFASFAFSLSPFGKSCLKFFKFA